LESQNKQLDKRQESQPTAFTLLGEEALCVFSCRLVLSFYTARFTLR